MKNLNVFFASFLVLFIISCGNKPSDSKYFGTWIQDNNPNCQLEISKEGPIYVVRDNCGHAGDYSYSMSESGSLSGYNGMVTISYIKESNKILLVYPPNKTYYSKKKT